MISMMVTHEEGKRERQRFLGSNKQTDNILPWLHSDCSHSTTTNLALAYDAAYYRTILCMHAMYVCLVCIHLLYTVCFLCACSWLSVPFDCVTHLMKCIIHLCTWSISCERLSVLLTNESVQVYQHVYTLYTSVYCIQFVYSQILYVHV